MNKKLMLFAAAIMVGFIGLTAFDGKTKADQLADIQKQVQAGLDAIRVEEKAKCDARVAEAVTAKVAELEAAAAAVPAPGKAAVKKPVAKSGKGGPKVDPLPQTTKPTDPQKSRGGAVQEGNAEQQKARSGAAPATPDPATQKKRGGAVREGGGGK
jgi:hypothetical protein